MVATEKHYKDYHREYNKKWYEKNKEAYRQGRRDYYLANKEKLNKNKVKYNRERAAKDINFKLATRLRERTRHAIRFNQKAGSAVKDLGCSIEELKEYLERQFQPGMEWTNWSFDGWHIDHIKPLSSFDLTDRQQFLEACHYTNLQPMWSKDNFSKAARNE